MLCPATRIPSTPQKMSRLRRLLGRKQEEEQLSFRTPLPETPLWPCPRTRSHHTRTRRTGATRSLTRLLCARCLDYLSPTSFYISLRTGRRGRSVCGAFYARSGLDDFLHADDVVETSECLSDEAIVARVHAADNGETDDSDDVVEEPTQVLSSQEAQRIIQSLRDFVFAKDLLLSYVEHLDALEKDVRQLRVKQSKLTDYGFSANK